MTVPANPKIAALGAGLYGNSSSNGIVQGEVNSYISAKEAKLRAKNDQESLAKLREDGPKLSAFLTKSGLTATDAQTVMSRLRDLDGNPRSEAAVQTIWPNNYETLKERYGGDNAAREKLQQGANFQAQFAREVPFIAGEALRTGANSDPQVLDVCIKYGQKE